MQFMTSNQYFPIHSCNMHQIEGAYSNVLMNNFKKYLALGVVFANLT